MPSKKILLSLAAVLLFLAGCLFILGIQWLMQPPTNTQSVTFYRDWRLTCLPTGKSQTECFLAQDIVNKAGQTVVRIAMGRGRNEGKLVVTVPHEVLIQPGFGLSIGKAKILAARYETCDGVGCIGSVPIDETLQAAIDDNDDGEVAFIGLDSKPTVARYSLRGFADGRKAFEAANDKYGSWWGFLVP